MIKYNLRRIGFLLIIIVLYCYSAKAQPVIENVKATDMKKAIDNESGVVILDVRRPTEITVGRIPGAENIDIRQDEFWLKFKALSKEKKYYVHCNNVGRSTSAARVMKQMGFKNVYNLLGGIQAWKSEGYILE